LLYFQLLTIRQKDSLFVADDVLSDAIARSPCVWLVYGHHPSLRWEYKSSHWQVKGVGRNIRTPLIDFVGAACADTGPTQVNGPQVRLRANAVRIQTGSGTLNLRE